MALRLEIKVVPSSGKIGFTFNKNQQLICYLKSPAKHGQANYELITLIAKTCKVTRRDVDIVLGFSCRNKIVLITTSIDYNQFLQLVGLEKQIKLF